MSENGDSLIKRAQEQGALFPPELENEAFAPLEKAGVFTAERLFQQRPLTYRQVIILSAHAIGQIKIGEVLGVSPSTVRAVQRREGETIGIVKTALSESFLDVASLATEELRRRLEDKYLRSAMETKDLLLAAGIATDKGLLLAGQATVRMEVDSKEVNHDAFNAFVQGFGTGLAAGTSVPKGSEAATPGPVIDVTPEKPGTDSESAN